MPPARCSRAGLRWLRVDAEKRHTGSKLAQLLLVAHGVAQVALGFLVGPAALLRLAQGAGAALHGTKACLAEFGLHAGECRNATALRKPRGSSVGARMPAKFPIAVAPACIAGQR